VENAIGRRRLICERFNHFESGTEKATGFSLLAVVNILRPLFVSSENVNLCGQNHLTSASSSMGCGPQNGPRAQWGGPLSSFQMSLGADDGQTVTDVGAEKCQ
jgi:hypothetical protein